MNRNLLKILIINTIVLIFFNFAHPVTPEMLKVKGMANSINGILYSFMSLGMVVGSPYFGKQLSTGKMKKIMITSLVGYAMAQILFGFGNSVFIMALGRFLAGLFSGGWLVSSLEYINHNTSKDNKTKFFAYLMVSNAAAAILGQIVAGELGTKLDYHYVFLVQSFSLIVVAIFIIFIKIIEEKRETKKGKKTDNLKYIQIIIYPLCLMFLFSLAFTSINSQIGYYFSVNLHKNTLFVGIVNSYINIITFLINLFIINKLYLKLKNPNIFIFLILLTISGILMINLLNVNILISMTFIISGLVAYKPVLQKISLEYKEIDSGLALGYLNSVNSIGMVLGSFISGLLYAKSPNYVIIFILFIGINIIVIACFKKKHISSKI